MTKKLNVTELVLSDSPPIAFATRLVLDDMLPPLPMN